jgi:assimilatory nitrate reductase catalytic subunit
MSSTFHFLQGIFPFAGTGLEKPSALDPSLRWQVPEGARGQVLYFRGGNSSGELVALVLLRSGVPMRYFPIGARGDVHVPLRVVEDVEPGEVLELHLSAPEGVLGTVVVDLGLVEV